MLCEVANQGNFFTTWAALSLLALVMMLVMSGAMFYRSYHRPTLAQWQRKSNPHYPDVTMVRREVLQMLKGLLVATACPAAALHLVNSGVSQAYCGVGDHGWGYLAISFLIVWIGSDFIEFYYHRLGHTTRWLWKEHKAHHVFYNPSPFAVIADDAFDQLGRAAPILAFPLIMPVNMDMLFFTYAAMFYGYGTYLHWGHELRWPDAHHPWLNTAFQHYIHHAKSSLRGPCHTGFFFKLWDQLFGSVYHAAPATADDPGNCLCAKCCTARGERSAEAFARIRKPDYSPLLSPGFWRTGRLPAPAAVPDAAE